MVPIDEGAPALLFDPFNCSLGPSWISMHPIKDTLDLLEIVDDMGCSFDSIFPG
jgi:hypothetical protein